MIFLKLTKVDIVIGVVIALFSGFAVSGFITMVQRLFGQ
jgi:hypothetical protein